MADLVDVHTILADRLRGFAIEQEWQTREAPYGDGSVFTINAKGELARVAISGNGQFLVLHSAPRLQAELLLWKATISGFESQRPGGRFLRHG
jgi:hypothetical protein